MQRKEAEKLLAALIFDDLDEASKTELLTYLQSDDELRERLADMRMAVKVTSDTVQHGPEPVLDKRRLKRLARLARRHHTRTTIFTAPRLAAAAAIFIIAALGPVLLIIMPSLSKVRVYSSEVKTRHDRRGFAYDMGYHYYPAEPSSDAGGKQLSEISGRYAYDPAAQSPVDMGARTIVTGPIRNAEPFSGSKGKRFAETSLGEVRGRYVYEPVTRSPVDAGVETIVTGPITNGGRLFAGAQTSVLNGDESPSGRPAPTEKWTSADHLGSKQLAEIEGRYGYDAAVRSPVAVDTDSGTIATGSTTNDGRLRLFAKAKEDIGGITNAHKSVLNGDESPSGEPATIEKWASAGRLESKPDSGVPKGGGYVGGGYGGGGYGGYGRGGGDGGGYGEMGGSGRRGSPGGAGGDGGIIAGDGIIDREAIAKAMSGAENGDKLVVDAGTYDIKFRGGTDIKFSDGDIEFRGKEITLLGTNPDDPDIVAKTIIDSPGKTGGFTFSNGPASGTEMDAYQDSSQQQHYDAELGRLKNLLARDSYNDDALTSKDTLDDMVHFKKELELQKEAGQRFKLELQKDFRQRGDSLRIVIDSLGVIEEHPVAVVTVEPELAASTKPVPVLPAQPKSNVSGPSDLPAPKLWVGSGNSRIAREDTKSGKWFENSWGVKVYNKNEPVFKKLDAGLGTKDYQPVDEKARRTISSYGKVAELSRQDGVSKEKGEESIDDSKVTSATGAEEHIKERWESTGEIESLLSTGEIESLLKKVQSKDKDFLAYVDELGVKRERGPGVPILGDIPLVGGLFRSDGKKQPLSTEEKKQIVEYFKRLKSQPEGESTTAGIPTKRFVEHLEGGKSLPEGESVETEYEIIQLKYADPRQVEALVENGFRDMPDAQSLSIEALPQSGQIIVFGRKDMREKVKKMAQSIDKRRPQVLIDVHDVTIVPAGEDGPDLPPALRFKLVPVNPWVMAERDSLSTFALDVDTASYTLCRRYIRGGFLPPAGAVRMEEFVNYFNYNYPQRTNPTFKVHAEAAASPFARKDKNLTLLKIGVKARTIGRDQRKAAHLIFVVDASASMGQPDRLGLVQRALSLLVNKLSVVDRVSVITCANEARLHLEATSARERDKIRGAIDAIQPAGPTNLLAGLKLGYATARRSFAPKQINHVVLCSDGVANVGQTEAEAVLKAVAAERKQGITITCVGVGYGSYNDVFMESLANRGDGSYVFLDSARQARQVFVEQLAATLQTVAKDARIQVDFNPNRVRRYRLIGYENRDIEDKRFRDDTIDAGEVGSGQCSTALYELELIGHPSADRQGDLGTVFVRYRDVETGQIEEISSRLSSASVRRHTVASAPRFFLAAGAARFAEILRQSEHAQHGNLTDVLRVAEQVSLALPLDRDVRELAELIRKAEHLPRAP